MKKLLHVSIIALFVIAPTLASAETRPNQITTDSVYKGVTALSDEDYEKLDTAEKTLYDTVKNQLLPADDSLDAEGVYFGLKEIKTGDETNVATSKYVKGAYNQLTKRINKIYRKADAIGNKEYEGSGSVNVCQDWDSDTCNGTAEVDVNISEKDTSSGNNDNPPANDNPGNG